LCRRPIWTFPKCWVYHDGFYGAFKGREGIREMIEERFHRDAKDFKWDMLDPVRVGELGYARYRFSFTSKLAGADGRRIIFEGMSCFQFVGDEIRDYDEIFDSGLAMAQLAFPPERLAKSLARGAEELRAKAESGPHLGV
jgi:hypothetical protein